MGGLPTEAVLDANTIRPGCVMKICHLYICRRGGRGKNIRLTLVCIGALWQSDIASFLYRQIF